LRLVRQSGQSLVEALIAIAIISGSLFYLLKTKTQSEKNLVRVGQSIEIQNDLLNVVKQVKVLSKRDLLNYLNSINGFKFFEKMGNEKLPWLKPWESEGKRATFFFITFEAFDEKGTPILVIPTESEKLANLSLLYKIELNAGSESRIVNGTVR
jgi:hypothetical protein